MFFFITFKWRFNKGIPYRLLALLRLSVSFISVDQYLVNAVQYSYSFPFQDLLLKACASLAFFVWSNELLPLDILLLALIDRDDDPHALRIVVCTF